MHLKNYLACEYWRDAGVVERGGLATAFGGVPPKAEKTDYILKCISFIY